MEDQLLNLPLNALLKDKFDHSSKEEKKKKVPILSNFGENSSLVWIILNGL